MWKFPTRTINPLFQLQGKRWWGFEGFLIYPWAVFSHFQLISIPLISLSLGSLGSCCLLSSGECSEHTQEVSGHFKHSCAVSLSCPHLARLIAHPQLLCRGPFCKDSAPGWIRMLFHFSCFQCLHFVCIVVLTFFPRSASRLNLIFLAGLLF